MFAPHWRRLNHSFPTFFFPYPPTDGLTTTCRPPPPMSSLWICPPKRIGSIARFRERGLIPPHVRHSRTGGGWEGGQNQHTIKSQSTQSTLYNLKGNTMTKKLLGLLLGDENDWPTALKPWFDVWGLSHFREAHTISMSSASASIPSA